MRGPSSVFPCGARAGLLDIVAPAIFLAFLRRYDISMGGDRGANVGFSSYSSDDGHIAKCAGTWRSIVCALQRGYFGLAFGGYIFGILLVTNIVRTSRNSQPALLYIAPAMLVPVLLVATLKGVLGDMSTSTHNFVNVRPVVERESERVNLRVAQGEALMQRAIAGLANTKSAVSLGVTFGDTKTYDMMHVREYDDETL